MRLRRRLIVVPLLIIAVLIAGFFLIGPERVWEQFGPADLGPVEFETVVPPTAKKWALACPPNTCKARGELTPPEYAVTAAELRSTFARVIASEPRIIVAATDDATLTDRYIQRTALMRYPDTIVVRFYDRPGGRSTIGLYSRSKLGYGDMGVNHARLERWLAKLAEIAPVAE